MAISPEEWTRRYFNLLHLMTLIFLAITLLVSIVVWWSEESIPYDLTAGTVIVSCAIGVLLSFLFLHLVIPFKEHRSINIIAMVLLAVFLTIFAAPFHVVDSHGTKGMLLCLLLYLALLPPAYFLARWSFARWFRLPGASRSGDR